MNCHNKKAIVLYSRSIRVTQQSLSWERFQNQSLLLGAESFDLERHKLTHLNTQDCGTIGIAPLIYRTTKSDTPKLCTASSVNGGLQGLLTHSRVEHKIENLRDSIQHVCAHRHRTDVGLSVSLHDDKTVILDLTYQFPRPVLPSMTRRTLSTS